MKSKLIQLLLGAILLCAGAVAAAYLAGALFYLVNKTVPLELHPDTWYRYWQAYQDNPLQAKRLLGSLVIALACVFGFPTVSMIKMASKPRALHGEARWATEHEIRKAGLL